VVPAAFFFTAGHAAGTLRFPFARCGASTDRVTAAREAERTGMPIEEAEASELWEAYDSVCAESYCPRCGKRLGPQKTMGSDGKYYHPECERLLSRGW